MISGLGRPLEKGKATHSSILDWRIPWTVQPMGVTKIWTQLSNFHFHTLLFDLGSNGKKKIRDEGNPKILLREYVMFSHLFLSNNHLTSDQNEH